MSSGLSEDVLQGSVQESEESEESVQEPAESVEESAESVQDSAASVHGGVVVGVLLGIADDNAPLVAFPGLADAPVKARTTVSLRASDIGSQVALLFENARLEQPLVIGKIVVPGRDRRSAANVATPDVVTADVVMSDAATPETATARIDDQVLKLSAEREIVLQCGKASITLTRAGKIILRGAYVLSRSSGVNKIKGGSVQIN